ncbi:MAG: DUF2177 family protein [Candidatus Dojkabacteria bacterium]|nr:DUF2177 family protein [Candidatus Dojkabacteria bacterium]
MTFSKIIILYALTFIAFLFIDLIWLGVVSRGLYSQELGHLMADKVKILPAFLFYILFCVGVVALVVYPNYSNAGILKVLLLGGLLGLVAYGTYDLTNYATLKDWPLRIVIIDMIWGTFLGGVVSSISYYIARWLGN